MKRTLFVALILSTVIFTGQSFALDVPPPPIDIDISNSKLEIVDSTQFRIRQVLAPSYPGTYWADFLWKPNQLLFQPITVGKEAAPPGNIGVALVSKGGTHYPDPIAAMNDIATWCGTPSETNPCLLKILPGVYDIGRFTLRMAPYVDIEGSGENITKITGRGDLVVHGAEFTEMRFLTVEHRGGPLSIAMVGTHSQKLTNITIIAMGSTFGNFGLVYPGPVHFDTSAISSPSPSPLKMRNATVVVSEVNDSIGIENDSDTGQIIIEHSSITGTTNSVIGSGRTFVAGTQLNGPVSGNATCAGVYDQNFVFYANTCP